MQKESPNQQKTRKSNWMHRVQQPLKSTVLVCTCGNKYLKTRSGQTTCVQCINKDNRY